MAANQRVEALGPAERIINSLTQFTDHAVHNRPGFVVPDARYNIGVRWAQATWVREGDQKVVYLTAKVGKRTQRTQKMGTLNGTNEVKDGNKVVGQFRNPGLFPEVVVHLYSQIAEVWKVDNEFAARWASYAYEKDENRDLKALLAAFMLVQGRYGEFLKDGDEMFRDEDYRAVGEAMCLIHSKVKGKTFQPKHLLRIGEILEIPGVIEVNRRMGFGKTARNAIMGRYNTMVEKYLVHLEKNTAVLEKLIKEGHRTSIMALARKVGYKPEGEKFFELLRWKQVQSKAGHRTVAVGKKVKAADSWAKLTEEQICKKIVKEKPSYKVLAGKLPTGITPAIMAAAIQAGCLSNADLIILTPTLEELGLLQDKDVLEKWKAAMDKAENQRAANVARNVKSKEVKENLEDAADKATAKAVEEVVRDFRIYVVVDKSGSMEGAIEQAKEYLTKFVGAFPLERLHVSTFNTIGTEVKITRASAAGVAAAFRGHTAGGGTSYSEGIGCLLRKYRPKDGEEALMIFVGDEEDNNVQQLVDVIEASGVRPVAFGLLHVSSNTASWQFGQRFAGSIIVQAAAKLGIPCFKIEEGIFADPYAVPRTIRNIIAATPVGKVTGPAPVKRITLVQQILDTPLLKKPVWA